MEADPLMVILGSATLTSLPGIRSHTGHPTSVALRSDMLDAEY